MNSRLAAHGSRLVLLAFVWLAWHVPVVLAESPPASIWETDLSAACSRAQAEAKPLVIYLSSSADEAHTNACRKFERGPLASPAMAGFREWTVLVKIDRTAPVPGGIVGDVLRAIDVTKTPAVAVVAHHRGGWQTYEQWVGDSDASNFIRILRFDVAHAMIGICRDRQRAMSKPELARRKAEIFWTCDQLRARDGQAAEAYDEQLARLRSEGQFRAAAFSAATNGRRERQRKWIPVVAELAALPDFEDDPLCEMVLNGYLLDYDVSHRLSGDLAALAVEDRLPNSRAMHTAQSYVRAADRELEENAMTVYDTLANAGLTRLVRPQGSAPTKGNRSKLRAGPVRTSPERKRRSRSC